MVCYYRSGFDPVPGCQGEGEENFDYCVPPDTPDKALNFIGDDEWNYYQLKECEGGKIHVIVFTPLASSKFYGISKSSFSRTLWYV